jgi:ferredoxin-type protein NapH
MAVITAAFTSIALGLWAATGSIFYLVNFLIIGACLGLGMGLWPILPSARKRIARIVSQVLVGGYMVVGLGFGAVYAAFGFVMPENMQIEGFWFWLFSGAFMASVLHYMIAKIAGPFLMGRGWCSWACWTVAVLDLLPWKKSPGRLARRWGWMRWITFGASVVLVGILMFGFSRTLEQNVGIVLLSGSTPVQTRIYSSIVHIPEFHWFIASNLAYYLSGIAIAFAAHDNRAFCKYLCPVSIFLKVGARFSLLKISPHPAQCTMCRRCEKSCPMDVWITSYIWQSRRVVSSECIVCLSCVGACRQGALGMSLGLDAGFKDRLLDRIASPAGRLISTQEDS